MPWVTGDPVRIVVQGPPKALGRNRHRIVKKRDRSQFVTNYMPAQSAKEQSTIRQIASIAIGNRPPLDGPVELKVVAYMPIPASWSQRKQADAVADKVRPTGRPDADNILKNICDSFQGIIVRNDTIFTDTSIWKRFSLRPRLVIECRLLTWTD